MPAPTPARLFFAFLAVSVVLFSRPPDTNFIFDEQEALLANPYLSGDMPYWAAFQVDFWGRPLPRTIGSYRPLPNLLWRPLAFSLTWNTPWLFACLNLLAHAGTATLLGLTVQRHCSASGSLARWAPWICGGVFSVWALSTEAVCSVVGLADLLVTFFAVLALFVVLGAAKGDLPRRMIQFGVPAALAGSILLGFLSKETAVTFLPLAVLAALLWTAPQHAATQPGTNPRGILVGGTVVASVIALLSYLVLRRGLYVTKPRGTFSWAGGLPLPRDPMNNPLLTADASERWWTASEIFARQIAQLFFPHGLSGDYSYPAQPLSRGGFVSTLGAALFMGAAVFALVGWVRILRGRTRRSSELVTLGVTWFLITYFPISGAILDLPTIRADRLLYLPSVGAALVVTGLFAKCLASARPLVRRSALIGLFAVVLVQATSARLHALDYRSDLIFWREASRSRAPSAKAHLNYGVMLGARGQNEARLRETRRAVQLAPDWPMGRIYLADTYCRMGRMEEAMEEYLVGLDLAARSKALTALSLQCIWDRGAFEGHKHALMDLAAAHPDTWLSYFVHRLRSDGTENDGIPRKYRPRRYNDRASTSAR